MWSTYVIPSFIYTGHMAVFIQMHKYNNFLATGAFPLCVLLFYIYVLFNASWLSSCFLLPPKEHQPSRDARSVRQLPLNILVYDFIKGWRVSSVAGDRKPLNSGLCNQGSSVINHLRDTLPFMAQIALFCWYANDTVDNQGANTLAFISGGEIIKRSWRVFKWIDKVYQTVYGRCMWESER